MRKYKLVYTRQAQKDTRKVLSSGFKPKVEALLNIIEKGPLQEYPPFERLQGDLFGAFSRRINIQHRLVYQILEDEKVVKVLRMRTHYE